MENRYQGQDDVTEDGSDLVSPIRNHGEVNIMKFQPETRRLLLELKRALAFQDGIRTVQITFDDVANPDEPPRAHVIVTPQWVDYWSPGNP